MESRGQRILNLIIFAGVLVVLSGMVAVPWDGPDTYLDDWFKTGLPFLLVCLAILGIRAPKYIKGGGS